MIVPGVVFLPSLSGVSRVCPGGMVGGEIDSRITGTETKLIFRCLRRRLALFQMHSCFISQ